MDLKILFLLFIIYSVLGWIFEVIETFIKNKKFIDRGFLIGPYCPIYGCGGVLMVIFLDKYINDSITLFIMCTLLFSVLEYFTSFIMEKIFNARWWDYSKFKFNINGRICLECAIPFGLIGIIMVYGSNPVFLHTYSSLNPLLIQIIALTLVGITIIDIIISFNVIINLKNVSNSLKCDSTEVITKKVREILLKKNILHRRLINSFPKMKISNRMSILKEKLERDKEKYKEFKKKIKRK